MGPPWNSMALRYVMIFPIKHSTLATWSRCTSPIFQWVRALLEDHGETGETMTLHWNVGDFNPSQRFSVSLNHYPISSELKGGKHQNHQLFIYIISTIDVHICNMIFNILKTVEEKENVKSLSAVLRKWFYHVPRWFHWMSGSSRIPCPRSAQSAEDSPSMRPCRKTPETSENIREFHPVY